ncbi:hypothetical protein GGX14DRAFT_404989 [Mycena pura]|uniref:Uncharacterized protein n=1 Tax=Mycena pura TaxID=153505 RepID=A0AAD6UTA5_9AGAR|nr:hypothetical protein GGX14DRAFT_404989 [Mycena pura]
MPTGAIAAAAVAASLGTVLVIGALTAAFMLARRRRLRATAAIPDACCATIRPEQRYLALEDELRALREEIARLAARPASVPLYGHEKDAEVMLETKGGGGQGSLADLYDLSGVPGGTGANHDTDSPPSSQAAMIATNPRGLIGSHWHSPKFEAANDTEEQNMRMLRDDALCHCDCRKFSAARGPVTRD